MSLRWRAEEALYVAARGTLRSLPHRAARPLGAALGELAWTLDRERRRIGRENLLRAFPDWSPARRDEVLRHSFRHFGAMLFDTISFARFDAVEVCRRLTIEGWEHARDAFDRGNGLIVVTAHLGNWELCSYPFPLYLRRTNAVARPLPNPHVWRRVLAERQRFGLRVIAKQGAAKSLVRALRAGEGVGLVMDQRVRPGQGPALPFFGQPALTSPLPAQLALRLGTPVLPAFAFPQPGGAYRVEVHPPLPVPAPGDEEERVNELTRSILRAFEAAITRYPEQWLWLHRRWRLD